MKLAAPPDTAVNRLPEGLPEKVGRFRVKRLLGRGSFANVALAWDEELESEVALKILHTRNPETENNFLEEARMLRRIQSLNVVAVHDIGRLPDGSPYLVLDYASHGTLTERLEAGIAGPQLVSEQHLQLLSLVDGLADGLIAIHNAGMVHRDIKPANILFCGGRSDVVTGEQCSLTNQPVSSGNRTHTDLLANGERVLVGDLGIAKDLSKQDEGTTLVGGTPFYLAPEQRMADRQITPAADTYSATALLWRVLLNDTPPSSSEVESKLNNIPQSLINQGWQAFFRKGMTSSVDSRYQSADEWRWSVHDVLGSGSSTVVYRTPVEPRTDTCPYKGLAAYEEGDSRFFRGRSALVNQLSRRLQLESVLVVGGPSGSGKSSLVRAGLVPALKAGALPGSENWQCLLMTPGAEPMQALRKCLDSCGGLTAILQSISSDTEERPVIVLVIDQFEEVFTLADAAAREEFLLTLSELTAAGGATVKLVLAVRADFYAECAREPWLAEKITSNQVLVGPMTTNELRQAITEPAHEAGYVLEKGLVSSIIQEAGDESGSLPLVAHALVETWVRRSDNVLTEQGFRDSGGVIGAISQSADATFEHKLDDDGREATRRLMLSLVNPGDGSPDTRRVVNREDILNLADGGLDASVLSDVIKKLTAARLLTVDDSKVQIAHEALLRSWPRLRQWIDESRDDLRMRRRINLQALEWLAEEEETDLLYRGIPLFAALDWRSANPKLLGELENRFLDNAKQRHEEVEQQAAHGRRRARRLWSAGVALLTLLAIGATLSSIFAYSAFRDSQQHAQVAQQATETANFRFAGALGAAAYGHYAEDPRLSLVMASEAMSRSSVGGTAQSATFDTRAAMVSARQVLAKGGAFLLGSPIVAGDALSIAIDPLGSILAIGNLDGHISFVDVETHEPLQVSVQDHVGGVRDLEFSPDGKSLASAGADGRLLLWQEDSAGIWTSRLLRETADVMPDVDFHPSGEFVLSANHDATVGRWYIDGRTEQPETLKGGKADVNALAISRDGRFVVAGNADKTISAWDLESGQLVLGPLKGIHSSHLLDVVFSPTANSFFTMTTDGEAKEVSFPEGEVLNTLFESKETVGALLVDSTSNTLIGGNNYGQLASWDIEAGAILQRSASGHSEVVKHASMTGDERLIATLGRDQLIRFWSINDNFPLGQQLQVNSKMAKSVVISPDGSLMASGDGEGQIKLWSLDSNDAPKNLAGHDGQVWALAFSADGRLLASADRLGTVKVWDVMSRRVVQIINTGSAAVWAVEFVHNNTLILATENTVLRYSVDGGELLESWDESAAKITRLTLSPDKDKLMVSYANGNVVVENVSGEANRTVLSVGDDLLWSTALNQSGTLLAAASSDETVSLFDMQSGERISKLTGHRGGATNVAFLGDGTTLVVSDRRGSIHWWDITTGRRLAAPWRGHRKAVWRMALHPDGNQFATAGDDGKIWIWDTLSVARACDIGLPGFDAGKKSQYLGDDHVMQACQ